jgi:hypothetical protein
MPTLKDSQKNCLPEDLFEKMMSPAQAFANNLQASQNYCAGFTKYLNEFLTPLVISTNYFSEVERERLMSRSPLESFLSYLGLWTFNLDLTNKAAMASMRVVSEYAKKEMPKAVEAMLNTWLGSEGENIEDFSARQAKMMEMVTQTFPQAVQEAEADFGFHFERGRDIKFAETDRFILYQVMPTDKNVEVREDGKPILILPPFVLGANILAFLPEENRSYTHAFANQGIPTYIRILKDISTTPALQTMTGEDDALDTQFFCEKIKARHGNPVTLNGYCQGGFSAVCDLLSGELDGLVDALITCVSPMDGTRSIGLKEFLNDLPPRFNDLLYGTKTLPNGNKVGDGLLMGWVYKLKSIEMEAPMVAFFRDMMMFRPKKGRFLKISKTAAALNYWLQNERNDLPLGITEISFASYTTPITKDGTLPIKLFGRELNFRRLREKGIQWLICYGERDDLVEKSTALAPLDFIDAEVSPFPKGHVAIATSWSDPTSACALHTRFGEKNVRGPVRYQLDLEQESTESQPKRKTAAKPKKKADTKAGESKNQKGSSESSVKTSAA